MTSEEGPEVAGAQVAGAETRIGEVTEDRLLGGRLLLRQPREGFRVAIDSVFLAGAVEAKAGESVLDLGCGVGGAALCLLARQPEARVIGLELQRPLVALASENAALNGVQGRLSAIVGDLRRPPPRIAPGSFDHVMANPPYLEAGRASAPQGESHRLADMESEAVLADWLDAGLALLKDGGSLTVIQRADRLGALLAALEGRVGGLVVFPLWAGPGKPARRVLVRAVKRSRAPLTLAPGLVLHAAGGGFTEEAEAILRHGAPLPLCASRPGS